MFESIFYELKQQEDNPDREINIITPYANLPDNVVNNMMVRNNKKYKIKVLCSSPKASSFFVSPDFLRKNSVNSYTVQQMNLFKKAESMNQPFAIREWQKLFKKAANKQMDPP